MDADITVEILREIRDEIRSTRTELKAELVEVKTELVQVNKRLDGVTERLDVVEHTLTDFAGQHLLLTRFVKNVAYRHDDELADLRDRVEKLEQRKKPS
ncbi:MAG TPA: hypothetical protein VMJ10_00905 [Kofleriaceae bacterium]|nr:hypothetical protein [Kofleriaceae bacterium]